MAIPRSESLRLLAIHAIEDLLANRALKSAGNTSPGSAAEGAELPTQSLGCKTKQLSQNELAFLVDRAQGLPDHGRKEVLGVDKAFVVLGVLFEGVSFAWGSEVQRGSSEGACDSDINGEAFAISPDGDRNVAWAATRGVAEDTFFLEHGRELTVRGNTVD